MTVTVKQIIPPKAAENTQTTQYTATGCKTTIDKFTVTNYGAANVAFSLNLVASGGSAGNTNLVIDAKNIVPDLPLPGGDWACVGAGRVYFHIGGGRNVFDHCGERA